MTQPQLFVQALGERYTIERELGRGGMATVYLARDPKHDRHVALKVLDPDLAATLGADRFLREIQVAGRLRHPHILPLYDSGQAGGLLYYVMPYVEGESLRARLNREKQLPIAQAVAIAREVADALDYAHRQGVVHRDIKPENILLDNGHAVVADFGIARAIGRAGEERLTGTGLSLGTPAYMSPEQAVGEREIDGRTDVYSLGCVLYEMLAGEPPFTGPTAQAVIVRRLIGPPPPIRAARPNVPLQMEQVVVRALAATPADRFHAASEFAAALAAMPPTEVSGGQAPAATESRVPSIAVLPFANRSADPDAEYFGDGLSEDLISALTKLRGLRVAARSSAFAYRGRSEDVRKIGAELCVATVLEGSVRKAGNRLRVTAELVSTADGYTLWSDTYDRDMQDVFAVQDEIARAMVSTLELRFVGEPHGPLVPRPTDNPEAYVLYLKGRYHWNKRPRETLKGLEYFRQAIERDPVFALAHAGVADCYNTLGSWEASVLPPREAFPKAHAAALKALEIDPRLAEARTPLGYASTHYHWRWGEAEEEFRRAISLNPGYPHAHHWYAHLLMATGRVDEALAESLHSLKLDPLDAIINAHLAWHYWLARQYDEAIEQCRRTAELDPHDHWPPFFLGLAYGHKGLYGQAIAQHREALRRASGSPVMLGALAHTYGAAGEPREARALLRELTALHAQKHVASYEVAVIHAALGERDQAFEWLDTAYADRSAWLAYLKVEPRLDPLRGDPRFAALLAQVGLR